jgi:AcrR family transcriptional regulator
MGPKEKILISAERLFATRGFDVSLREISMAASQRNHSAVQYHFGGKGGLVAALYEFRMRPLNVRRAQLLAELLADTRGDDPGALIGAHLAPLAEHVLAHRGTSWYLRLTMSYLLSRSADRWPIPREYFAPATELAARIRDLLPDLTQERFFTVNLHMLASLAFVEGSLDDPAFTDDAAAAAIADLAAMLPVMLTAPATGLTWSGGNHAIWAPTG